MVRLLLTGLAVAIFVSGCDVVTSSAPEEPRVRAGGETTLSDATANAFQQPAPNLSGEEVDLHDAGDAAFAATFVSAPAALNGGLGPVFNNTSCESCHIRNGRAVDDILLHVSRPGLGEKGQPQPVEGFGLQLQDRAITGFDPEARLSTSYRDSSVSLADGETVTLRVPEYTVTDAYRPFPEEAQVSPRAALPVFGLGLLEAIPASSLERTASDQAANGNAVTGRVNRVWNGWSEQMEVGRFGWKATKPTLRQQTADAYHRDMGVTNPMRPTESAAGQEPHTDGLEDDPEITSEIVTEATFYVQSLGVPARRNQDDPQVQRGRDLFKEIGCATCHQPAQESGTFEGFPFLSNQRFAPYTDLLLHDMGPALADGRPVYGASGSEWRTPPLWGLGLHEIVQGGRALLHDGRARTIQEAILWHGGEAEPTRERFRKLSNQEREALLRFLRSL